MSSYLYELPTTGAISFSDFCYDQTASYVAEIAETTETRANLRVALKEYKRSDDDEKDYLRLVKILDEYIPKLHAIISCIDQGELVVRSEPSTHSLRIDFDPDLRRLSDPVFSWRTTLSSNTFHSSPRLSVPSLSSELAFSLLTYGFSLSNLARSIVISLRSYETERAISDTERKAKDERLGHAVAHLRTAAGIYEFIAKEVLAKCDLARETAIASGLQYPHPPELSREVLIGLSKMALADAQTLAIRKLLSKAAYESTLTPGPPLPRSHPSPALAAKLHLECATCYSSARALVKTPGSSRPIIKTISSGKSKSLFGRFAKGKEQESPRVEENHNEGGGSGSGEVTSELRQYLASELGFHNALAHKWLGVNAGEDSQGGTAVGFLTWAKKELEDLKNSGGPISGVGTSDREKDMREARKIRVNKELQSVGEFLKGYKKMNDSLTFQDVPPVATLQASIPAGIAAVQIIPYKLPAPPFGPGSASYLQKQSEELAALNDDGDQGGQSRATYAGAGAYY